MFTPVLVLLLVPSGPITSLDTLPDNQAKLQQARQLVQQLKEEPLKPIPDPSQLQKQIVRGSEEEVSEVEGAYPRKPGYCPYIPPRTPQPSTTWTIHDELRIHQEVQVGFLRDLQRRVNEKIDEVIDTLWGWLITGLIVIGAFVVGNLFNMYLTFKFMRQVRHLSRTAEIIEKVLIATGGIKRDGPNP